MELARRNEEHARHRAFFVSLCEIYEFSGKGMGAEELLRAGQPHSFAPIPASLSYFSHFQRRTESNTIRQFGPPFKVNLGPSLSFSLMTVTALCLYVLL